MRRNNSKKGSTSGSTNRTTQKVTTPTLLQMHGTECGAACLGMVLGHFGRWVPLTELRDKCEVSRDGSSAASISRAAKYYGLECGGLSLRAEALKMLQLPVVLFWQFSHFVVLEGYDEKWYYLNDPATGRRRLSEEEFSASYSGIALRFNKGAEFKTGGKPPALLKRLAELLDGAKHSLVGVLACGFMLSLLTLLVPTSLTVVVDQMIQSGPTWTGLIGLLLGAGVLAYCLSLLQHRFLKRLAIRLAVQGYDQGLTRLLHLPIDFFQHRMEGDLTDRVSSIDRIAKRLTEGFLVLLVDLSMSFVLLVAMFFYDALLTVLVLLLGGLHVFLARSLNRASTIRSQAMLREQGTLLGVGMQMLNNADNLRMTGADDHFFSRWCGQQARELSARQLYSELASINTALPNLIAMARAALILAVGVGLVQSGELTLGMLVGFYILAEIFLAPIGRFLEFSDERQALEADFQRLDDIAGAQENKQSKTHEFGSTTIPTLNGRLQLTGHLELRNITFGFNKNKPPLIKDFNLEVKPGQRVALVGPSGSGKSTLAHLISGMYQPWSGEVLFDGHLRTDIPEDVLSQSIAVVDQDVVLFSASLRDNITLWNPEMSDEAIFAATRDACIHDEILIRPSGYATQVEQGGTNFSGGQRQRLEIARALVGSPTILILDEATSSLDAETEELVDLALRRRGMTCLIVAHRLSTVRDCDELIVLDKGVEVQRGTHDELIADEQGAYFKLVRSG